MGEAGLEPATFRPPKTATICQLKYSPVLGTPKSPNTYVFVFDTTASAKFHLSFDKEEELPSDYTSQTPYDFYLSEN